MDDKRWDPRQDEADAALEAMIQQLRDAGEHGWTTFLEVDESLRWTGAIGVVFQDPDVPVVDIGGGIGVPERVTIRRGTTTVVVDSTGDRPTYTVTVQTNSPKLLSRLHLLRLVEQALGSVTVTTRERPRMRHVDPSSAQQAEWIEKYGFLPVGQRVWFEREAARRHVRANVTDRDIERAAEAYRDGGIDEVKRVMHVGTRQAWRYVQRAQDKKLLPRQRKQREKKS